MEKVRENVIAIVVRTNKQAADHLDKSSLTSDGILDSLDIMNIINELEKEFNIEIDPADVSARNFESIDTMAALVERYKKAGARE